jgi:hypothetical protein
VESTARYRRDEPGETIMSKRLFVIASALAATQTPVRETVYDGYVAALKDLARVIPGDTEAIFEAMRVVEADDGIYVYADQASADADDDGSTGLAVIARAPEVEVTLTADGMGEDADESDYDAYVAYVSEHLDVAGAVVTVEAARFGEGGEARIVVGREFARGPMRDIRQEVKDSLVTLWDAFCADTSAWPAKVVA